MVCECLLIGSTLKIHPEADISVCRCLQTTSYSDIHLFVCFRIFFAAAATVACLDIVCAQCMNDQSRFHVSAI